MKCEIIYAMYVYVIIWCNIYPSITRTPLGKWVKLTHQVHGDKNSWGRGEIHPIVYTLRMGIVPYNHGSDTNLWHPDRWRKHRGATWKNQIAQSTWHFIDNYIICFTYFTTKEITFKTNKTNNIDNLDSWF